MISLSITWESETTFSVHWSALRVSNQSMNHETYIFTHLVNPMFSGPCLLCKQSRAAGFMQIENQKTVEYEDNTKAILL